MTETEDRRLARWLIWAGAALVLAAVVVKGCTPAPAWAGAIYGIGTWGQQADDA